MLRVMPEPLHILAVAGSPRRKSASRIVVLEVAGRLRAAGCAVDLLDLAAEPLPPYNPDTSYSAPHFPALKARVERADVVVLGTPDYHGGATSLLRNFLEHFWHEFAGKLFVPIVASHEKGLTVIDQLRTVARQCYGWALPYGVSLKEDVDTKDGQVVSEALRERIEMLARDVRVYGALLAEQRRADLAGTEPGFLAKLRK